MSSTIRLTSSARAGPGPGNSLRDIAQGNHSTNNPDDLPDELGRVNFPWNPALVGLPNLNENFHLVQYMKDVYLDSQVTVAIMTNNNSAAILRYRREPGRRRTFRNPRRSRS